MNGVQKQQLEDELIHFTIGKMGKENDMIKKIINMLNL